MDADVVTIPVDERGSLTPRSRPRWFYQRPI